MEMKQIQSYLCVEDYNKLKVLSKSDYRTVASYVRELLVNHIKDKENGN